MRLSKTLLGRAQRTAARASTVIQRSQVLGSATIGDTAAGLGMTVAYAGTGSSPSLAHSGMGLGLAAVHGLRGAAFLWSGLKVSAQEASSEAGQVRRQQRFGVALGEGLLAAGNLAGALGAGMWAAPMLLGGVAVNLGADFLYRSHFEGSNSADHGKPLTLSTSQKVLDGMDALAMGSLLLGQGSSLALADGLSHVAVAGACYAGKGNFAKDNTHSRHSKGYGHAMQAVGLAAAAGGAGWMSAVPVLAGGLTTNLQDLRDQ